MTKAKKWFVLCALLLAPGLGVQAENCSTAGSDGGWGNWSFTADGVNSLTGSCTKTRTLAGCDGSTSQYDHCDSCARTVSSSQTTTGTQTAAGAVTCDDAAATPTNSCGASTVTGCPG